ncbi:HD family phosphohydrolase [bacterium]
MVRNWRTVISRLLLYCLKKLAKAKSSTVTRKESMLSREIHIPVWLVVSLIYSIILGVLLLELGFYQKLVMALILFVSVCAFFVIYFLRKYDKEVAVCDDSVTLIGLVTIISILFVILVKKNDLSPFVTPLPLAAMIINILLGPLAAFIISIVNILFFTIVFGGKFSLFFFSLFSVLAAIKWTEHVYHRRDITKAGLYVSMVNAVSVIIIGFLNVESTQVILENCKWAVINSFGCVILTIGVLPYLEGLFSITTNIRLLELADFSQPVLKKMMLEAPGTYHHSLMVGNMAENAAQLIDANPLLVRVASYYHDIGKIDKSEYFIENKEQNVSSKHADLSPNLSSLILLAHVKEGTVLAKKHKLNKDIIDIIEQHHGTSLIHYFYKKALKSKKETVDEEKYRYPGPKPKSKEAALIMLADSVEAASRAARNEEDYSHSHLKHLVGRVINNKFVDGQLDECNITLADLHKIANSFVKSLVGIYHDRIA